MPEFASDGAQEGLGNGEEQVASSTELNLRSSVDARMNSQASKEAKDALKATAAAAMQESDRKTRVATASRGFAEARRTDSVQNSAESVPQLTPQKSFSKNHAESTDQNSVFEAGDHQLPSDDTLASSPTLSKHTIRTDGNPFNILPAVHATASATEPSPTGQNLPCFRQLTVQLGPLSSLAEAATQQDPRAPSAGQSHGQSLGNSSSQSPALTFIPPYASTQSSPTSQQHYGHRSPPGTTYEIPRNDSSQEYPGTAYYAGRRRSSTLTDRSPVVLPTVPSLPSNSSSGESFGHNSSGTEGYSTTRTTPFEAPMGADNRPILPPPPGLSVVPATGYICDYPGCNALPFQTQYLLSSHRNVHSNVRTHYCPVKDCPRSEGGKGFKRKNEMIRHGLVHQSPGYVCPYCPDREHRYPRPDNLQRHVRVHHVDKDRDDPVLREILAQRQEGGKQRRRRTQSNGAP